MVTFGLLPAVGSGAATTRGAKGPVNVVRELPELRTETSDTSERSDGTRVAKIARTPINYRDSSGTWQPISTKLQPSANGGLEDSATKLPVSLPSSLSSPVTVGSPGATVSFAMENAGGSATAKGSTASYAEALPNVSASYQEQATRLKETLSLANASAPTVYRYRLEHHRRPERQTPRRSGRLRRRSRPPALRDARTVGRRRRRQRTPGQP